MRKQHRERERKKERDDYECEKKQPSGHQERISKAQRTMTRTDIIRGMATAPAPPSAMAGAGVSNKGVAAAAVITAIDSGNAIFTPLRFRSIGDVGNRKASKQVSDIISTAITTKFRMMVNIAVFLLLWARARTLSVDVA